MIRVLCCALLPILGCAVPVYTACGIDAYDERVPADEVCAAVDAVELAYFDVLGQTVDVESVVAGVELRVEELDAGVLGLYEASRIGAPSITLSEAQTGTRSQRIDTLTHEIVHRAQDTVDGFSELRMREHACPYYGLAGSPCVRSSVHFTAWRYATGVK